MKFDDLQITGGTISARRLGTQAVLYLSLAAAGALLVFLIEATIAFPHDILAISIGMTVAGGIAVVLHLFQERRLRRHLRVAIGDLSPTFPRTVDFQNAYLASEMEGTLKGDRAKASLVAAEAMIHALRDSNPAVRNAFARALRDMVPAALLENFLRQALFRSKLEEELASKHGDKTVLLQAYLSQAVVYETAGLPQESLSAYRRAGELSSKLGSFATLATSLAGQASILEALHRHEEALQLLKMQEELLLRLGFSTDSLAHSYFSQARILLASGDYDPAIGLLRRAREIFDQLNRTKEGENVQEWVDLLQRRRQPH